MDAAALWTSRLDAPHGRHAFIDGLWYWDVNNGGWSLGGPTGIKSMRRWDISLGESLTEMLGCSSFKSK